MMADENHVEGDRYEVCGIGNWRKQATRLQMKNPWTQKNPFMSMWLSQANRVAGATRGRMSAQAKRQASAAMIEATRQIADFWTEALIGQKRTAKRRRTKRK